jgi:hypothetical protein
MSHAALWAAFEAVLTSEQSPAYEQVTALGAALVACQLRGLVDKMEQDEAHFDYARHALNTAVYLALIQPPRDDHKQHLRWLLDEIESRDWWMMGVRREWAKLRAACKQELQWDTPADVKPDKPTAEYCLPRRGVIRWNGERKDVPDRLCELLDQMLDAGDRPIPFGAVGADDGTIGNKVTALSKILLDIDFPWRPRVRRRTIVRGGC